MILKASFHKKKNTLKIKRIFIFCMQLKKKRMITMRKLFKKFIIKIQQNINFIFIEYSWPQIKKKRVYIVG
jgi:hypothetical protein